MRRNRGEYMKNLKKLTILHSNDMHGDFLAEQIDERLGAACRCSRAMSTRFGVRRKM